MVDETFFDESSEQSQIKSRIVTKYFRAWARVIIPAARTHGNRIAYIDLFAGPGRYEDGTPSTPLIILRAATEDLDLRDMLVTLFNDKDSSNADLLRKNIQAVPGIEKLKYEPRVETEEVGERIARTFEQMRLIPSLLFIDPWGYKGLSLKLINAVLRNWGCDCVFFFNYNRINAGLNNAVVREHMNSLFGEKRVGAIIERLEGLNPEEREALIIEELSLALQEEKATFVLPFTFKNEQGTRTKHYLIFVSKSFRGYEIMKEIMAGESSERDQGVASFVYSPASKKNPLLFELSRPLDDLEQMLLTEFAGHRLPMRAIYERHSIGRPYVAANYKRVLTRLEAAGRIKADPPAERRRKIKGEVTFGDDVVVTFPSGVEQ
jgi:three-Cys-motif partner protein